MSKPARLRTEAWLLRGLSSAPGVLRLERGSLSFTATGRGSCWDRHLRELEKETGREGLAERLGSGKAAVVFTVPFADVKGVIFPWYYFSGGFKITIRGVRYRFSFIEPANNAGRGGMADLGEISKARRAGKAWQAALTE